VTEHDPSKFAIVEAGKRVWAVGAIHGECKRLVGLHSAIESRFMRGDRLVYLGNYLGRGDAIIDTMNELLLFRRALLARFTLFAGDIVFLRGSQEEMWQKLTQLQMAQSPSQVLEWMFAQGVEATLRAYGLSADRVRMRCREGPLALARWSLELREAVRAHPGHEALLSSLRRAALTDSGGMLFVHAGIDADRPLDAQGDSFWWGGGDFDKIVEPYDGFVRIVRGYDAQHRGTAFGPVTATVDGRCGFGGRLAAACFARDGTLVETLEA